MNDLTTIKTDDTLKPTSPQKEDTLANVCRVDFGKFQYFPFTRELKQGEAIQRLASSPSALLELLIKNGGKPILRQEIVKSVWLGKKEVLDGSFYQVIKRLRIALDDGTEPRKVITNPLKNAYALHPKITLHYKKTKRQKRIRLLTYVTLFLTLSGSALAYIFWPPPVKIAHYNAIEYQSITSLRGKIKRSEISPDSSIVVFSHRAPSSKALEFNGKANRNRRNRLISPI